MRYIYILSFVACLPIGSLADEFILRKISDGKLLGPYRLQDGYRLDKSNLVLAVNPDDSFTISGDFKGIRREFGPFNFLNGETVTILDTAYILVCDEDLYPARTKLEEMREKARLAKSEQLKIQKQTDTLAKVMERTYRANDYESAIRSLNLAIQANPLAINMNEANRLLSMLHDQYEQAIAESERQRRLERARQEAAQEAASKREEERRIAEQQEALDAAEAEKYIDQIPIVVNALLKAHSKGDTGLMYWEDYSQASMLYAPVAWEILDTDQIGARAKLTVRIESSNKGGSIIRKLWKIRMRFTGGAWKVSSIDE